MDASLGFSPRLELPNIPAGPGICVIEDENGRPLQVVESINIRRRIGELLDSEGKIAVHGPNIYAAQERGERIFVRWKLTADHKIEKADLMRDLGPAWAPRGE